LTDIPDISEEKVERYVLAGVLQLVVVRKNEVDQKSVCRYRELIRGCLLAANPSAAVDKLITTDEAFRQFHPDRKWLQLYDKLATKAVKKGRWKQKLSGTELISGLAAFVVAYSRKEPLPSGEAREEIETLGNERLFLMGKDVYKELTLLLEGMSGTEWIQAMKSISTWSDEKCRGLKIEQVKKLAAFPAKSWRAERVADFKETRCTRRLNRLAAEAWHCLSPPVPARGWAQPRVYYKVFPESVVRQMERAYYKAFPKPVGRRIKTAWVDPVLGIYYQTVFGSEDGAINYLGMNREEENPITVRKNSNMVECFGWQWATADDRWETFRKKFKGAKRDLSIAAADLLGLNSPVDLMTPKEKEIQEDQLKELGDHVSMVSGSSI
jgi:hypothetical protein